MAATIPADVLQFFGMAIKLAQELSYLYGAEDLWKNGEVDNEKIRTQLIMYCGVMFGVSGAVSGVRVLSSQLAKTTLKKLPQKALTKTFWYPMVKQIGKFFSIKVTKSTVAKGVSKAIPIVGGVISGGLNFASMMPMANRLQATLDKACFNYSDEEMNDDIKNIENISDDVNVNDNNVIIKTEANLIKDKVTKKIKSVGSGISDFVSKHGAKEHDTKEYSSNEIFEKIEKLSKLKDMGAITENEFNDKKSELLKKL
ncbi:MAG: SHOCT domain-containing protein [Acutalibacteraceae bacterium]